MKQLLVIAVCVAMSAAFSRPPFAGKEEDDVELLRMLKNLLENEKLNEKKDAEVKSANLKTLTSSQFNSKAKRGSYCVPNEECVFPFTYYGIEHNSCTTADSSNGYWCSTDAEYSGGYVYCACKGCDPDPRCTFPFTYKDVEYTECTDADHGNQKWCSRTSEYQEGSGSYINCNCHDD